MDWRQCSKEVTNDSTHIVIALWKGEEGVSLKMSCSLLDICMKKYRRQASFLCAFGH